MDFFKNEREAFQLLEADWRAPQLGALGSLLAHWSLTSGEPALVSLPTGAGKTAVGLAAPFLMPTPPSRVLVLVPSTSLRDQTVRQFATMRVLREIRALTRWYDPPRIRVMPIEGTSTDWTSLDDCDVVVAIPQSISPASEAPVSVPPSDMFDLVLVDEAHHLPSRTWSAVLDHLRYSAAVLLTATPFRLDKKPVPGTRAFHYPLRQAIAENFYKPIRPVVLSAAVGADLRQRDARISNEVLAVLAQPDHATSVLLIRARDVQRANRLAEMYRAAGLEVEVLTSRLSDVKQLQIIRRLKSGDLRAVAVVGMLGEGFDLPRLRVVAYHDKHKSLPSTVQLIGRLARVSSEFPQESVLVTTDDADVYPELQGVVRDLYKEDSDWARILPGIVDAEVEAEAANRAFVEDLDEFDGDIDPMTLRPMPRPVVYEVPASWEPLGTRSQLPASLHFGEALGGARIIMSAASNDASLMLFVTRRRGSPAWSSDPSLEAIDYRLSLVSFRRSPRTDLPALLFVDADDLRIHRALMDALAVPDSKRPVASDRLDGYLQSLPRTSVSSIGMRNILAGTSGTTYKTRAGRSTDTDLLAVETARTALGHVIMQISAGGSTTTVGGAFEKGRIWQRRYKPVLDYVEWITEAAELLWFPRTGNTAKLLPQISRGRTLTAWPAADPIAVEPNPATVMGGYELVDGDRLVGNLEDFELFAGFDPTDSMTLPRHTDTMLPVVGVITDRSAQTRSVCWTGQLSSDGAVSALGTDLFVRRGYVDAVPLSSFLEHYPPLIYFLNGQAVQGHELFEIEGSDSRQYDVRSILSYDWSAAGADIAAETRRNAEARGAGMSVHECLERYLLAQQKSERWRWIICNDGAGEIADYIVIEWSPGRPVRLSLWHAKGAGGAPGLRVKDFQEAVGQALRSRSRFSDPTLWSELRDRMMGRSSPRATVVAGSDSVSRLLVRLGEPRPSGAARPSSWPTTGISVHGEIAIVQPGLSTSQLLTASSLPGSSAESLHQLFAVVAETVAVTGNRAIILGSP